MEDNNKAAQNAHDGSDGGDASPDELQTHIENEEFQEFKDMEVDNEVEQNNEKESPSEHSPRSPELPADGLVDFVEGNSPSPTDADVKELSVVIAEDEEPLNNGFTSPRADLHEEIEMEGQTNEPMIVAENGEDEANDVFSDSEMHPATEMEIPQLNGVYETDTKTPSKSFLLDANDVTGDESGTEEEQAAFMKELETFHRERLLDFRPPRFYQEPLNLLKLWRACIRVGGYEQATSLKLWRQVGESFKPPKTCTTVSWTFRGFYEKALLEYEKYKMRCGELPFTDASYAEPGSGNQADHAPSGRAIRNSAARAMQGWHSRLLGNGEVGDPIIKDKNPNASSKREKPLKNIGFLKRKGSFPAENALKVACVASKPQEETMILDVGVPADWVKVNVQRMKDCYEVYALVPGLLREEVRVQSDPAGRLVISGEPEQLDNPWGVTPFKKVVSLPTRIDPHQTSAVVTMQGQLFVRVPFEQADI